MNDINDLHKYVYIYGYSYINSYIIYNDILYTYVGMYIYLIDVFTSIYIYDHILD